MSTKATTSGIAFYSSPSKVSGMSKAGFAAILFTLFSTIAQPMASAQTVLPPEREDRPPHEGPRFPGGRGDRDRGERGDRDRGGRGDRGDRGDKFKGLSEPDRKRVREAFEKVWELPEVEAAKQKFIKANDEYREAIQQALEKVDPEAFKILEKSRPPFPGGPPLEVQTPDLGEADFASKAVARLGEALQKWASRSEREEVQTSAVHAQIIQTPEVSEAVKNLEKAETSARPQAWENLRDVYRAAAMKIMRKDGPGPPRGGNGNDFPPPPAPEK